MFSTIKRLVPRTVKSKIKKRLSEVLLRRCVRRLTPSRVASDEQLEQLRRIWGNLDWTADVAFLRAVCGVAISADGPILECGSGLTTLLIAIYAGKRGIPTLSLEQDPEWQCKVSKTLRRLNLPGKVEFCPLKEYGDFDWYTLPPDIRTGIGLVICDGPPGSTRGNRVGLLPVCKEFLVPNCVVLLDDAERAEEQSVLRQWVQNGAEVEISSDSEGAHARVVVP